MSPSGLIRALSAFVALLAPATGLLRVTGDSLDLQNSTAQLQRLQGPLIPPMLILQRGCTGSSVVIRMTKDLLADLGVAVFPLSKKEIVRTGQPYKNPWWSPDGDLGDAMRKGVKEASDAGQVLVFNAFKLKSWTKDREELALNKALLDMDTRTVIVHRRNPLDILTCEIRDCFVSVHGVPRGYPVDEKGQRDDTCFDRRQTGAKVKAYVNLNHLQENLDDSSAYPEIMKNSLRDLGLKGRRIVYYEDLVSHEYSADNLDSSAAAWRQLLSSLGVSVDIEDIKDKLKKAVGTYPPPEPHSELIYNIEGVEQLLSSGPRSMQSMLRH
eukprot:CAMPEP_0170594036 /NCGR_PEP_ID=MMETSP0224-20130122/13779_1 /TAXON_ID=285029 /ORGANISM="Togula jolla, Strain CCCM 725" /LENGTH=325 /DNA_ID=CAMNT_0010918053 /DNA_START=87 /DNA_END=1064 /DNA_ORIENTATION=-